MFQDVEELKEFIEWSKQQGIQAFSVGEVTVNFNPYAIVEAQEQQRAAKQLTEEPQETNEDEELLYYSSNAR